MGKYSVGALETISDGKDIRRNLGHTKGNLGKRWLAWWYEGPGPFEKWKVSFVIVGSGQYTRYSNNSSCLYFIFCLIRFKLEKGSTTVAWTPFPIHSFAKFKTDNESKLTNECWYLEVTPHVQPSYQTWLRPGCGGSNVLNFPSQLLPGRQRQGQGQRSEGQAIVFEGHIRFTLLLPALKYTTLLLTHFKLWGFQLSPDRCRSTKEGRGGWVGGAMAKPYWVRRSPCGPALKWQVAPHSWETPQPSSYLLSWP